MQSRHLLFLTTDDCYSPNFNSVAGVPVAASISSVNRAAIEAGSG